MLPNFHSKCHVKFMSNSNYSNSDLMARIKRKLCFKIKIPILLVLLLFILLCVHYMKPVKCSLDKDNEKNKPKYELLIVILTAPDNMERRNIIRRTWMSEKYSYVKYFFAIGTVNIQQALHETLQSENHKHKDLLLLPTLRDSYNTITKKVLYSFKQLTEDYDFDFLLKCDDDSYVVIESLLKELSKWQSRGTQKELYWGYFNGRAQVKRHGPWKETNWILCDYYLPYALGGGYVLSSNLVKFISRNWEVLKIYSAEDVSVGVWLAPLANIERKHDTRFDTEYQSRGCSNDYIITHKQSIQKMQYMHELSAITRKLCSKELIIHKSYQYNWTVPPSQCCNREQDVSPKGS
ncbi:beta-1,3-galactosyltransferase 6 [Cephus cinctus]|uniref:Hexosyltransferase n=1 Tax=Cephus cinctus TaxID=211228 RepID=A0AAJ7REJ6_CEPCN|nr:beta-1,3-galactosyltransferase 6 [Cephus cinctus]